MSVKNLNDQSSKEPQHNIYIEQKNITAIAPNKGKEKILKFYTHVKSSRLLISTYVQGYIKGARSRYFRQFHHWPIHH